MNDDEQLETTAHDVTKRVLPQLIKLYRHNGSMLSCICIYFIPIKHRQETNHFVLLGLNKNVDSCFMSTQKNKSLMVLTSPVCV